MADDQRLSPLIGARFTRVYPTDRRREQVHAVFRVVPGNSETATPIHNDPVARCTLTGREERNRTTSVDDTRVCVHACVRARKTITVKPFGPILTQPAIAIMDRRVGITRCRARILRSCLCLDSCTRVHATNPFAPLYTSRSWTPREFSESYDSPTTPALVHSILDSIDLIPRRHFRQTSPTLEDFYSRLWNIEVIRNK